MAEQFSNEDAIKVKEQLKEIIDLRGTKYKGFLNEFNKISDKPVRILKESAVTKVNFPMMQGETAQYINRDNAMQYMDMNASARKMVSAIELSSQYFLNSPEYIIQHIGKMLIKPMLLGIETELTRSGLAFVGENPDYYKQPKLQRLFTSSNNEARNSFSEPIDLRVVKNVLSSQYFKESFFLFNVNSAMSVQDEGKNEHMIYDGRFPDADASLLNKPVYFTQLGNQINQNKPISALLISKDAYLLSMSDVGLYFPKQTGVQKLKGTHTIQAEIANIDGRVIDPKFVSVFGER